MLSYQKGVVKTSVRHLVEFLFRGGDITTGSSVSASPEAMLEGSRLHRKDTTGAESDLSERSSSENGMAGRRV